jgi:hypothetical protein
MPFGGIYRRLERMKALMGGPIDLYLMGHIHTSLQLQNGYGSISVNGSWIGTGDFGANIGYGSLPLQSLLLITPERPLQHRYEICLTNKAQQFTVTAADLRRAA